MQDKAPKARRQPIVYSEVDLQLAKADVERLSADTDFRGRSPGQHRAALRAAVARVEMIQASMTGERPKGGRKRRQQPIPMDRE